MAITPTGSLKKNKTTQIGCACQVVLNDNDVPGDHSCRHPNGALVPPELPERLPPDKGVVFNVCLPPNLNLGLDAGAEALSDDEWARQVDEYCTKTMADTTKDLLAYMSKRLCDGNCM